eukprot:354917-Chlamydomonas_euryale.AAC.6
MGRFQGANPGRSRAQIKGGTRARIRVQGGGICADARRASGVEGMQRHLIWYCTTFLGSGLPLATLHVAQAKNICLLRESELIPVLRNLHVCLVRESELIPVLRNLHVCLVRERTKAAC